MPMPSFGRGGARSGSTIGRRNFPGTGRGFRGSLLRTRVGRSPWALALGDVPDYGCAAYDDRVDAAVRAGAVLFPKRPPW